MKIEGVEVEATIGARRRSEEAWFIREFKIKVRKAQDSGK